MNISCLPGRSILQAESYEIVQGYMSVGLNVVRGNCMVIFDIYVQFEKKNTKQNKIRYHVFLLKVITTGDF